jgi:hypothetical protein
MDYENYESVEIVECQKVEKSDKSIAQKLLGFGASGFGTSASLVSKKS